MVSVADWSATPGSNATVDGINIAENCPAANVNGGMRAIMAGVRSLYDALPSLADYLKKDGTVAATGELTRNGQGAFLHHNSASNLSGRVFVQPTGGATPSMVDGDILIEY